MKTLERMPRIAAPPHDPQSVLLAGWIGGTPAAGFRARVLDRVHLAGVGALVLEPAPSASRLLTEASGSFGGLSMPFNAAVSRDGTVLLLDPVSGQLLRFDACVCRFERLPCFTRVVPPARDACVSARSHVPLDVLADPHGIAVRGDALYIADSGHARVVCFSVSTSMARSALKLPRREAEARGRAWFPFAVAVDGRGHVFVSDPSNLRVDEFDAQGRWRAARTTPSPAWALAVDCHDHVHALLADAEGMDTTLSPARWRFREIGGVPLAARAVRLDEPLRTLPPEAIHFSSHFGPARVAVDAAGAMHLVCVSGERVFDARGQELAPTARAHAEIYRRAGVFESAALDAGIEGCTWHRVELRGECPAGSRIAVRTLTAHVELSGEELAAMPLEVWSLPQACDAMSEGRWDCLVRSRPGRFLWLRLELGGDGQVSPLVCAALVESPRVSLRRYLPAVFGADEQSADFTDRLLAVYDATLRSVESKIDGFAKYLDPLSAPTPRGREDTPDFLGFLASWIGLTLVREWPEARRRHFVKRAASLYPLRGTPRGLHAQLLLLLGFDRLLEACPDERCATRCEPRPLNCGVPPARRAAPPPPLILEHFRLRRWLFAGRGKLGDDSLLWGKSIVNRSELSSAVGERRGNAQVGVTQLNTLPDPERDPLHVHAHRFSVFVPARVRGEGGEKRAFEQLLARETPAHAACDVHYVEPRFRVGRQAMVGLDSVIARTPRGVSLARNELGRATVLTSKRPRGAPGMRVGDARVGTTTPLT